MTFQELATSIATGAVEITRNLILSLVHATVERFEEADENHDREIAATREQINRLEDRVNESITATYDRLRQSIEACDQDAHRSLDTLAKAIEALSSKLSGPTTN